LNEFKNPEQEPGAEKRLLLTFALVMVVLFGSQWLMQRFGPKPATPSPTQQQQASPANKGAEPVAIPNTTAPVIRTPILRAAKPGASQSSSAPVKQAEAETTTIIENELYRITFTNRGAQVKSWILKRHKDDKGNPLDLVNARAAEIAGYPLSLYAYDQALREKLNSAMFVASATGEQKAPTHLSFEYSDGTLTAHKSFSFDDTFTLKVQASVTQNGSPVTAFPAWPSSFGDQVTLPAYAAGRVEWDHGEKIERQPGVNHNFFGANTWIADGNTITGPINWAGVADQYFAAAFLPDDPNSTTLVQLHRGMPLDPNEPDPKKRAKNEAAILGAAVGTVGGESTMRLFVGPKNLSLLQSVRASNGTSLSGLVDFGFWAFIAKPLFLWLRWTQQHIIVINAVLFPLRFSSMKSALKMQKVQPEVNAINRRYQGIKLTDPRQQEKQREVQEIYKREGINPAGGCVPMLIQFPFLIAFYSMLSTVNELRHAPWMWVHDLSSPDPWKLLPLTIIVTMFVMQRITPMTGMDPAQAKMMQTMMPLMMGLISWNLPAGLGVYWVTGNLIGFVQQYYMNKGRHAQEIRGQIAKRDQRRKKKD
jgi:YidC/Oxa1 family membrane protein insertase